LAVTSVIISNNMNTDNLVQTIRERFDHDSAKQVLKEKYESKMLFADSEGMWKAGPDLIAVLSTFSDETIVLTDTYSNPCKVNREHLLATAKERWQEQMNAWLVEANELRTQR